MKLPQLVLILLPILFVGAQCSGRLQFKATSQAMLPTLTPGEIIEVQAIDKQTRLKRWQIVVFRAPKNYGGQFAMRVIGLPNERVSIRMDGVYIDGTHLDPPPQLAQIRYRRRDSPDGLYQTLVTVPDDSYYVLGDNPDHSNDSRSWGPLRRSEIIGVIKR